ncbi:sugar phosphate isomerase/epimerase family protein [Enterococcus timonensis]|uniref:sugar phosphate isomerase/epimerase family protein n=1 Tax=Enterococcus timonensis TaxID=1852364 RepID=UPI0008D94A31|nr:sugar phosphate isomerase/epimerase family protein [Enterococcus timonensis]
MIPLNLGIRAHDLVAKDINELTQKLNQSQMTHIQLAVKKSFPELAPTLSAITPGAASFLGDTLRASQIKISVLGCYVNISSANPEIRREALVQFKHHLTLARDFGATVVGTETGSVETGYTEKNFTEEAYITARNSVIEMVETAEKLGVTVGIEGGLNHPLHTWQRIERLLQDVQSPNLKIIFDPANLVRPDNFKDQVKFTTDALDHFGDAIAAVHLKDFVMENNQVKIVPVGTGLMDYTPLLQFMKTQRPLMFASLEGVKEDQLEQSRSFILQKYQEA